MDKSRNVSRQEWQRVLLFAGALMLITTLPYVLGWLSQGDEWEFGGFLFGVEDGYSYLAKMRLGAQGDWLFTIRYTSEPHDGALLFLPYILLGHLTGLLIDADSPNLVTALAITFHLARIVTGTLLILVSYRFAAFFLRGRASRMLALTFITLGGGLGWALSIVGLGDWLGSLPVDFYVPEGYSFLILFGLPHLALARSALLSGFLLLFHTLDIPGPPRAWLRWSVLAGLCWLIVGLCVPFYLAVLYLVLGIWGLAAWFRERRFPWSLFWRATSAGLIVLPLLIYTGVIFLTNDVFKQWSAQNQLPSPHPLHYVLGYAALGALAAGALRWAWRKGAGVDHLPYVLLTAWVVAAPVMVYLPVNVQRRLAEGVIVPLGILAAAGLRLIVPHRRQVRVRPIVLALVLPTAILLWLGGMFSALNPKRPIFHPQAELHALDALAAAAPSEAVVLSAQETGNYLPARTDLIAYIGHGPETLHMKDKERRVEQFFAGTLDAEARQSLLKDVDYVFFGPLEQAGAPAEVWAASLKPLAGFEPGDPYIIYEVPCD